MKKQEFKKNEQSKRRLWDISKSANIRIIGVPVGEEEQQEIENLFEKIMKKLPYFGEGNRSTSPGITWSPKQAGHKEEHTKTQHN